MEKAKTGLIVSRKNFLLLLSSFLILLGAILIVPYGNFQEADTVPKFWIGISIMSLGFIFSWKIQSINSAWFWSITILARLILIPMEPGDDIWRYLWEGYIQNLGFSPYNLAPNAIELIPYRTEWWSLINHPDTSAIYPPLSQLGFRTLALINPSVLIFKLAFILADLGICWLLTRKFGWQETLIYAWNPLIIYSFAGGGHYDSWFLLPLVAGWLLFRKKNSIEKSKETTLTLLNLTNSNNSANRGILNLNKSKLPKFNFGNADNYLWYWSAFLIGVSVAIKWMSLPILSFLIWQKILDKPQHNIYRKIQQAGVLLLIGLLPMCLAALNFCQSEKCSLIPTSSNFVVKGRSAEFIPYLISLIWEQSTKYNWIYGIPLCLGVAVLIWNIRKFINFAEWYFFLLFTLSPIVHAWYFTWLIPFAVATKNLGTKWVSLSAFIYFILKHRQALGDNNWFLTLMERYWLWLPFVVGFIWSQWKYKKI